MLISKYYTLHYKVTSLANWKILQMLPPTKKKIPNPNETHMYRCNPSFSPHAICNQYFQLISFSSTFSNKEKNYKEFSRRSVHILLMETARYEFDIVLLQSRNTDRIFASLAVLVDALPKSSTNKKQITKNLSLNLYCGNKTCVDYPSKKD